MTERVGEVRKVTYRERVTQNVTDGINFIVDNEGGRGGVMNEIKRGILNTVAL